MKASLDAVDARRLRIARTMAAAVIAGLLWAMLALELIEVWCDPACDGADFGLMPTWAAVAAVAAGRLAWRPAHGNRTAGLALLAWTAWCVVFADAAAVVLAGPFLDSLLGIGPGFGLLVHWTLVAAVHVGGGLALARWADASRSKPVAPS